MSIQTNLSVSPYFDDYSETSDYYKILFKPATAVQVRELNQLQTLLQKQIEQFGDHVLKRGTLLDGCQATFDPAVPYIKIKDITAGNRAVEMDRFKNLFARNNNHLHARIIDTVEGFETRNPDLKTLYLQYLDSGRDQAESAFSENQTITIYNPDLRLYSIRVLNRSEGFSENDRVVITSAIEVQEIDSNDIPSASEFEPAVPNETIILKQGERRLKVIGTDETANTTSLVVNVKPLDEHLADGNIEIGEFFEGEFVRIRVDANNEETDEKSFNIVGFCGKNASANLSVFIDGGINNVSINTGGKNYYVEPHVSIAKIASSPLSKADIIEHIENLSLQGQNFLSRVVIAPSQTNPVGFGYRMTVGEGRIYQKGHFLRVNPQSTIVSKYSNTPSDVAVGFETVESIVNSAIDESLADNASGFLNRSAPGADRLKLEPRLVTKSFVEAEGDPEFFPIFRFSEGRVFSQSNSAVYNKLGDEMAKRTFEKAGNFILDRFNVTTRSTINFVESAERFSYVIDSGHAYINGYRVKTDRNYAKNVPKSKNTITLENSGVNIFYGNYLRITNLQGNPSFSKGEEVSLSRDNEEFGTAKIRSLVYHDGKQGTDAERYDLYLFDVQMNPGRTIQNINKVNTNVWSAEAVPIRRRRTSSGEIQNPNRPALFSTNINTLLFNTNLPLASGGGDDAIYQKRTQVELTSQTGALGIDGNDKDWPYISNLSPKQKNELIIIPRTDAVSSNTSLDNGTVSGTTLTGSGFSVLEVGDYLSTNGTIGQIVSIQSDTSLTITAGSSGPIRRVFPAGKVIPSDLYDAEIVNGNLNIDLAFSFTTEVTFDVTYNRYRKGHVVKTPRRKRFVKIEITSDNLNGPWCLGIPDIIRMRNVYVSSDSNVSESDKVITDSLYVDHNQTMNYYGLGYLYIRKNSRINFSAGEHLLVELDYLEHNSPGGLKTIDSYPINDSYTLTESTTTMHTMEIPEVMGADGTMIDLREAIDLRPCVVMTAADATTPASATINPGEIVEFPDDDLFFPTPMTNARMSLEHYVERKDSIILNSTGMFEFLIGQDASLNRDKEMVLFKATVPPYPSLPRNLSAELNEIIDTRVMNESFEKTRVDRFTIETEEIEEQVQGYKMDDIAQLERRIEILEYYSNLSQLEDRVKDQVFPSSVDSTLERFKFGFFVDNFADYSFTNTNDPEYNASIFAFVLQPAKYSINLPLELTPDSSEYLDGSKIHFPWEEHNLLTQEYATTGPAAPPEDPEPEVKTVCQFIEQAKRKWNSNGRVFEDYVFTLADSPKADGHEISIKFQAYSGIDRYEFYQSDNPSQGWEEIGSNSTIEVLNISSTEKARLNNLDLFENQGSGIFAWDSYGGRDFSFSSGPAAEPNYWVRYVGEMKINYELGKGRYFKVRMIRGTPVQAFYICYPANDVIDPRVDTGVIELPPPNPTSPTTTPPPPPRGCPPGTSGQRMFWGNTGEVTNFSNRYCQPIGNIGEQGSCPPGQEISLVAIGSGDPNDPSKGRASVKVCRKSPAVKPTNTPQISKGTNETGTITNPNNQTTVARPTIIRDTGSPKTSNATPDVYTRLPTAPDTRVTPRPTTNNRIQEIRNRLLRGR